MKKEMTLVQIIDGEELLAKKSKTFTDPKKAEKYFAKILREDFGVTDKEDIESYIEDGYFADDTHFSVIINEIPADERCLKGTANIYGARQERR